MTRCIFAAALFLIFACGDSKNPEAPAPSQRTANSPAEDKVVRQSKWDDSVDQVKQAENGFRLIEESKDIRANKTKLIYEITMLERTAYLHYEFLNDGLVTASYAFSYSDIDDVFSFKKRIFDALCAKHQCEPIGGLPPGFLCGVAESKQTMFLVGSKSGGVVAQVVKTDQIENLGRIQDMLDAEEF